MAIVPNLTDFETCKPNDKIITKPKTYFKPLQYMFSISKIEILILPSNALALFQLFFSHK